MLARGAAQPRNATRNRTEPRRGDRTTRGSVAPPGLLLFSPRSPRVALTFGFAPPWANIGRPSWAKTTARSPQHRRLEVSHEDRGSRRGGTTRARPVPAARGARRSGSAVARRHRPRTARHHRAGNHLVAA